MKKNAYVTMLLVILISGACSSNESNNSNTLNGTEWQLSEKFRKMTLTFHDSTFDIVAEIDDDENGIFEKKQEAVGRYKYKAPDLEMTIFGNSGRAVISGNKMFFEPDEDGEQLVFTKKN
ncbi:hypothetical protein ABLT32_06065 [Bacteroides pyogenes]|uniref:hypothetical protein n=1 Tax=Bacteroides pyogenes TaxID=310300 RepID=UPI004063AF77